MPDTTARRPPGNLVLTLCVGGGVTTWAVRFAAGYLMVPPACELGPWVLHAMHALAVLVAAGFVILPIVVLRRGTADTPQRFLLLLGFALNAFFLATVLLESSAAFVVDACDKGAIP